MDRIDVFGEDDVSAVADMHGKIFYGKPQRASDRLRAYYRHVFLGNPWRGSDSPSLVFRSDEGKVIGFVGVVPKPMNFMGREIKAAVIHRIMADPDKRIPFVGSRLVRRVLDGPQDLSMADGANDRGRAVWEAAGGNVSYLHSMNWIRPLRPFVYGMTLLAKKGHFERSALVFRPFSRVGDWIVGRRFRDLLRPAGPANVRAGELTAELLLHCFREFTQNRSLYPLYDSRSIEWVWELLNGNRERGELKGTVLYDKRDRKVGAYLYYLRADRIGEVMFMVAGRMWRNEVVAHLLNHAWEQGAACVGGRLESEFIDALWAHRALVKKGSWGLVHARDEGLLNVIRRGDAFISALDGELLFRSPRDRL